MKSRTKAKTVVNSRILAIAGMIAVAVAIAAAAFAYPRLRPLRIGLYDLSDGDTMAIRKLTSDSAIVGKRSIRFVELDPLLSLEALVASRDRPDLVLAYEGMALAQAAARFTAIPDDLAGRLPSTMRRLAATAGKRYGLALQADHFELAFRTKALGAKGIAEPRNLEELRKAALSLALPEAWPIFVAGGDDLSLLLLVSALVESRGGLEAFKRLEKDLSAKDSFRDVLDATLAEDSISGTTTLRAVLNSLVRWRDEGLLHPEWFRMSAKDISPFMGKGFAPIILMPLSQHRAMSIKELENYASTPFPPVKTTTLRALCAPILVASIVERSPRNKESIALLSAFISQAGQKKLCDATGLAPAAAAAEALDIQASDARLWVAASQAALPDLGRATRSTGASRRGLAKEIRQYLETGGMGY